MNEELLKKLLREPKEQDRFDFKASLKLYQSDGKLVEQQRDELVKDILGLANGNSHIIRKTKYLIIGADDKKFDINGIRVLYDVDYKVTSQSELAKWLSSACAPAVVGFQCELVRYKNINLFVITIPPTFDLHETTRELKASGGHFNKYTVFMRQDEHTVPASVRDGITIQRLKHLYRQEIANPSSVWLGILVGGIVAFLIGGAKIESTQANLPSSSILLQIIFVVLGIFFGGAIGWFILRMNETRYDWRYMSVKQRIALLVLALILLIVFFAIWK